jgi:hypothetical protein
MTVPWRVGQIARSVIYHTHFYFKISLITGHLQKFQKHVKDFYSSDDFKAKAQDAFPFFKAVKDYVFGRPTTLENAVRLSFFSSPEFY